MTDTTQQTSSFRLTFNLPAVNYFFEMQGKVAVEIKITDDGEVLLRGQPNIADNCVSLVGRTRGGCEAVIDGDMTDILLTHLQRTATQAQPFFTLHRSEEHAGWVAIKHFSHDKAPGKFTPHMRLWVERTETTRAYTPISDEICDMMGDIVTVVRVAKQKTMDFAATRSVGRPPKDIVEAREILATFKTLVHEIFPEMSANYNIDTVREAHTLITKFVTENQRDVA